MVLPAETLTVWDADPGFVLHLASLPVPEVTGELFTGWRTAAVEVVLPAMRVVQISMHPINELASKPRCQSDLQ